MARPKPDAQKVHKLILDKAIELIQKEGYPQLTMRRLANDSAISVGKIYQFFPSKDALFLELEIFFFLGRKAVMTIKLDLSGPICISGRACPDKLFNWVIEVEFYRTRCIS